MGLCVWPHGLIMLFMGLSPLAITMALIWKTKEVIFNGVFGARH